MEEEEGIEEKEEGSEEEGDERQLEEELREQGAAPFVPSPRVCREHEAMRTSRTDDPFSFQNSNRRKLRKARAWEVDCPAQECVAFGSDEREGVVSPDKFDGNGAIEAGSSGGWSRSEGGEGVVV